MVHFIISCEDFFKLTVCICKGEVKASCEFLYLSKYWKLISSVVTHEVEVVNTAVPVGYKWKLVACASYVCF